MRVVAANNDEVGVVLSKDEAAVILAAMAGNSERSLKHSLDLLFYRGEVNIDYPLKHVMPMFDWLKKWINGRLP